MEIAVVLFPVASGRLETVKLCRASFQKSWDPHDIAIIYEVAGTIELYSYFRQIYRENYEDDNYINSTLIRDLGIFLINNSRD